MIFENPICMEHDEASPVTVVNGLTEYSPPIFILYDAKMYGPFGRIIVDREWVYAIGIDGSAFSCPLTAEVKAFMAKNPRKEYGT